MHMLMDQMLANAGAPDRSLDVGRNRRSLGSRETPANARKATVLPVSVARSMRPLQLAFGIRGQSASCGSARGHILLPRAITNPCPEFGLEKYDEA
jgi:hypothetical protein